MELNFEEMEKLFCQNEPTPKNSKPRQRQRATPDVTLYFVYIIIHIRLPIKCHALKFLLINQDWFYEWKFIGTMY